MPQEVNVVPDLSVAENIYAQRRADALGHDRRRRAACVAPAQALADFGLDIDPRLPMSSLDLATQQLVVIARALAKNARLLILDEPTAALTENESLQPVRADARAEGARASPIIFVSHRLAEVFAISDRIVVMRDGRIRGRHRAADVSRQQMSSPRWSATTAPTRARSRSRAPASVALEVRGLSVFEPDGRRCACRGLDLTVRKGEMVGLFGLLGAGCIEAALAIYGAWPGRREGAILVDGDEVDDRQPRRRRWRSASG